MESFNYFQHMSLLVSIRIRETTFFCFSIFCLLFLVGNLFLRKYNDIVFSADSGSKFLEVGTEFVKGLPLVQETAERTEGLSEVISSKLFFGKLWKHFKRFSR
jgi:hypothetical protein